MTSENEKPVRVKIGDEWFVPETILNLERRLKAQTPNMNTPQDSTEKYVEEFERKFTGNKKLDLPLPKNISDYTAWLRTLIEKVREAERERIKQEIDKKKRVPIDDHDYFDSCDIWKVLQLTTK